MAISIEQKSEPGKKFDSGKMRYDLLPPEALDAVVGILTYGAVKYDDRNWEKGMSWGRIFGAMCRHSWTFWRGENYDAESGLHHMAHAACCAIMLLQYSIKGVGSDTRPNREGVE